MGDVVGRRHIWRRSSRLCTLEGWLAKRFLDRRELVHGSRRRDAAEECLHGRWHHGRWIIHSSEQSLQFRGRDDRDMWLKLHAKPVVVSHNLKKREVQVYFNR